MKDDAYKKMSQQERIERTQKARALDPDPDDSHSPCCCCCFPTSLSKGQGGQNLETRPGWLLLSTTAAFVLDDDDDAMIVPW